MGKHNVTNVEAFRTARRSLGNLSEDGFRRCVRRLEKDGLISVSRDGEISELALSRRGCLAVVLKKLNVHKVPSPIRRDWDGRWRLVSFDIPESRRARRRLLREGLLSIGCFQIHESLFAHPADCREAVADLGTRLAVERNLRFILADSIEGNRDLESFFFG